MSSPYKSLPFFRDVLEAQKFAQVLAKHEPSQLAALAKAQLEPLIKSWAGDKLLGVEYSGSNAKGTAISPGTDVDLFISLSPETTETLQGIYEKLGQYLKAHGYKPTEQNVSWNVKVLGISVDLVPAKKWPGLTNDHSLYRQKAGSWTKTNVRQHITLIKSSGRIEVIKAIKIWRNLNSLEFPSFYLELAVIEAMRGRISQGSVKDVQSVLRFLSTEFSGRRIVDPANSNNIISDDLTTSEKTSIAAAARTSLLHASIGEIIW
jgi:hypothetical protein